MKNHLQKQHVLQVASERSISAVTVTVNFKTREFEEAHEIGTQKKDGETETGK